MGHSDISHIQKLLQVLRWGLLTFAQWLDHSNDLLLLAKPPYGWHVLLFQQIVFPPRQLILLWFNTIHWMSKDFTTSLFSFPQNHAERKSKNNLQDFESVYNSNSFYLFYRPILTNCWFSGFWVELSLISSRQWKKQICIYFQLFIWMLLIAE